MREKVDGVPVGQHPIITRLVKGVFNVRPPIPRYCSTWDVQNVLNYLDSQGKHENSLSAGADLYPGMDGFLPGHQL